jgi:hypothetical protein
LTDLTKKGAFKWSEEAQFTFDKMKKVMSTCLVLALPDFSQPFTLECDASREGIGAIMMQNRHPLAYESQKLRGHELLYNIYDRDVGHHACSGQIQAIPSRCTICVQIKT